jgi:hypothetical protein
MSKKKNNLGLLIVFAILLIAVGANQLIKSKKGERSFRKDIIEMEANDINKISIFPKNSGNRNVDLFREDSVWKLKFDGKMFAADQEMINSIVEELVFITPERLVANKRDLWGDYDITDTAGTKIMVYGKGNQKTQLTIGRFSYNQSTRKPSSFIRIDNEKEVYAVEGYLGMTFSREINNLRDKKIFRCNQNDLTQIELVYPSDSSFAISKQENKWMLDGVAVDSTRMSNYLSTVSYLVGGEFRDDFTPSSSADELYKLIISGQNMKPVEIKAYRDATGTIINSSENPSSYFSGEQQEIFARIFQGKKYFFAGKQVE